MKMWHAVLMGCVAMLVARSAHADTMCGTEVTRANVVACAVQASLAAKSERYGLDAIAGRRTAAGILLPSNPGISLTGAYPVTPGIPERPSLWSVGISQELEIAGQRGARLDVVASEERAQRARLAVATRDAGADALIAYFDVLAARQQVEVTERLVEIAAALRTVAEGRVDAGVGADIEAQIAGAAATRYQQLHISAQQRVGIATRALATLLGLDPLQPSPRISGELVALDVVDADVAQLVQSAIAQRAEIGIAAAESEAHARRAKLLERVRFPNPTVSLFVRNDWIAENTVGFGIGIPLPLPAPVGRTFAGEISESAALAARSDNEAERLRRLLRRDVVTALEIATAARRQRELFRLEQVQKAETTLRSIAEEIEARRLPVREALFNQQALIDLLVSAVEARRVECVASVELARVASIDLVRRAR